MIILPSFFKEKSAALASSGLLLLTLTATGCQSASEPSEAIVAQPTSISSTPTSTDISQPTLIQQALRIQHALANKNFSRIAKDIHPTRGVRFSMYAYVRPESDKVFSRAQYAQYLQQSKIRFTWGERDGSGEPLIIPLPTYLDTWVDGRKFNNVNISVNKITNNGNSINNLKDIYQNSDVVEFYYKGSDEYSGLDWRVLRLVFDEYQGKRYLVAVVNDQWTV
ncbi:hypothetical protein BTW00_12080 [Psychrobacter sp. C 20.9]|uniref:hypothetical protein n=1 Tax=Psychrobacter sp. C 20.9 TaxID=1926477 RepID=UPI0009469A19|nr:hypothetical protein [Psychrobacter sp. C 20.9]OLF34755.1 hypothetical protein BTW00_12080 [Psychrobacter sp. C 20.9]